MTGRDEGFAAADSYRSLLSLVLAERDALTQSHCDRVAGLCAELGRRLGLTEGELARLALCATLHDIGKIGIPDRILLKAGAFDREEWRTMKTHAERGQRLVLSVPLPGLDDVGMVVRHHHEHFDGGGYPDGLGGEDIPLFSRIVAIADGYDAMASPRTYHHSRGHKEIMEVMEAEGESKYDPRLYANFADLIGASGYRAQG